MMQQVKAEHYSIDNYDTEARFASYWAQIRETLAAKPSSILEIGKGNGFYATYMKQIAGMSIVSLDIDSALGPDVVGSVTDLPFGDKSVDLVVCFQVLEHLPFAFFGKALGELSRVCRSTLLVSLPDVAKAWYYSIHIPLVGRRQFVVNVPNPFPKDHVFDGQHYWEIAKKGYPLERIENEMRKAGLDILDTYKVPQHPYHRFFRLAARPD